MIFIHEWQQEIWFDTPKGVALCKATIWNGPESNLKHYCFVQETGEGWEFDNSEVRAQKNITLGRRVGQCVSAQTRS